MSEEVKEAKENPAIVLLGKEHEITAFASNDPSRYVIQGVHYNAKHGCVEATNGRQLIRVPVTEDGSEFPPVTGAKLDVPAPDCILPGPALKKAIASAPNGKSLPILQNAALSAAPDGKVRLTTNDLDTELSAVVKPIEGNYPNTDQVIPTEPPKFAIALSAHELRILAEYCAKHGDDTAAITLQFTTELKPMTWKLRTRGGRQVFGVVMPCRMS